MNVLSTFCAEGLLFQPAKFIARGKGGIFRAEGGGLWEIRLFINSGLINAARGDILGMGAAELTRLSENYKVINKGATGER